MEVLSFALATAGLLGLVFGLLNLPPRSPVKTPVPRAGALVLIAIFTVFSVAGCAPSDADSDGPADEPVSEPQESESEKSEGGGDAGEGGDEPAGEEASEDSDDTRGSDVNPEGETLAVHFIDVGQGDSILLETDDAKILIDGGTRAAGEVVVQYLIDRGIRELDLVIGTHPHADHIGGLIEVFRQFKVYSVIDAGVPHTTVTFDDYLTEIERQVGAGHMVYQVPEDQVLTYGALTLSVIGPAPGADLGSLNDNSVVARVDFGTTSFIFTGDAEKAAEAHLLGRSVDLKADVLKVGHHGSRTSTTQPFLEAVSPEYAVIQVGEGNRYGHPTDEVLARLHQAGVQIFRNDLQGTVVFISDGSALKPTVDAWTYETSRADPEPEPDGPGSININTASLDDLQAIIHVGEARAQEIVDKRPFSSLDDLLSITGIGPARLQDIKDQGMAYVE